jgi:FMN phosphatase YigB (HAD superfamily)
LARPSWRSNIDNPALEERQMQSNYRTSDPKACSIEGCESSSYRQTIAYRSRVSPKIYTHPQRIPNAEQVLLLDLDNTLTDTRRWFADFILDATFELAHHLNVSPSVINSLFAEVAQATTLHEYAFVVESICSRLNLHKILTCQTIRSATQQFWQRFASEHQKIQLYDGVRETLGQMRVQFKDLKIIILTDSPEWVALERLSITGILPLVDGVVAIRTEEPKLRHAGYADCLHETRQRVDAIQEKISKRHLLLNLSMPASFAKPSSAGVELVAKRLGLASGQIIICGDKDTKEGQAANQFRKWQRLSGMPENRIDFVRADYGNHDLHHSRYVNLAKQIRSLSGSQSLDFAPVPVSSAIGRFDQLPAVLGELLSAAECKNNAA